MRTRITPNTDTFHAVFRIKSFSISVEVLHPPFKRPPLTLTSLLMAISVTKSSGIVETLFPFELAIKPNVSKSEKALGFDVDKFADFP